MGISQEHEEARSGTAERGDVTGQDRNTIYYAW
jgi:hypothetical protein